MNRISHSSPEGNKQELSNYQPISLTSVIGKMLEGIIAREIHKHLETHHLIVNSQHGFSKGKLCLKIFFVFLFICLFIIFLHKGQAANGK